MAVVVRRPCALSALVRQLTSQTSLLTACSRSNIAARPPQIEFSARNYSRYKDSPLVEKYDNQYDYEVVKNPPEWKYVEQLLPFETIPQLTHKNEYPSGFVPPKEEALNLPYFLPRTKNHQLPIYLGLTFKGTRRITHIRKIEGDIWEMNDKIKKLLKEKHKRYVETKVHEFTRCIEVKGDFVLDVKDWAYSKGF